MNQISPEMNQISPEKPSLASLDAQLEALKKTQKTASPAVPSGDAARGAIDFASASAVGILLGYGTDYLLGSLPWGTLAGLVLGVAAGFRLLMRASTENKKDGR